MNEIKKAGSYLAPTDEERLLISRAAELSARPRNLAVASCFLTPGEQRLIFECAKIPEHFYFGGARGCTRRKLIFLPDWIECDVKRPKNVFSSETEDEFLSLLSSMGMDDIFDEVIVPVKITPSGYEKLSHRDVLGAIMALGIKRETIGDICFFEDNCYIFCERVAADYICEMLNKAGRDTVKCEKCTLPEDFEVIYNFEDIVSTVASPRLDGVVRALCNISRDEAANTVEKGLVELNYLTEYATDTKVENGDTVSVRGYGKFIIDSTDTLTRRGRYRLCARKYI